MNDLSTLIAAVEGRPGLMLALARALLAKNDALLARDLAARALALAPSDPQAVALATEIMNAGVHDFHFNIVRDEIRNVTYDAALRAAIRPGMRVLDIGAGTGLLALMAARAGAAQVITCEMNLAVAEAARQVVSANGFADRVKVVAKHSSDLDVGADLGGPADLLVSEIVSNDLLGEGALPAHEQAVRRLLRPGAIIIPARGKVRAALADSAKWRSRMMAGCSGFDLSPFNALQPRRIPLGMGDSGTTLKSEAVDLLAFDFQSGGPFPEGKSRVEIKAGAGGANGIVQWIRLEMDDRYAYENRPRPGSGARSCWAAQFYPFPQAMVVAAGDSVAIHCSHDRHTLRIWADRH
jgi:type II protein arginine methyltransferase